MGRVDANHVATCTGVLEIECGHSWRSTPFNCRSYWHFTLCDHICSLFVTSYREFFTTSYLLALFRYLHLHCIPWIDLGYPCGLGSNYYSNCHCCHWCGSLLFIPCYLEGRQHHLEPIRYVVTVMRLVNTLGWNVYQHPTGRGLFVTGLVLAFCVFQNLSSAAVRGGEVE